MRSISTARPASCQAHSAAAKRVLSAWPYSHILSLCSSWSACALPCHQSTARGRVAAQKWLWAILRACAHRRRSSARVWHADTNCCNMTAISVVIAFACIMSPARKSSRPIRCRSRSPLKPRRLRPRALASSAAAWAFILCAEHLHTCVQEWIEAAKTRRLAHAAPRANELHESAAESKLSVTLCTNLTGAQKIRADGQGDSWAVNRREGGRASAQLPLQGNVCEMPPHTNSMAE